MKNFNNISHNRIIFQTDQFFIMKDRYPVSPGHCLIISKKVKPTFFDLTKDEQEELTILIKTTKEIIEESYSPDGYNIGMNCGPAAGQSIMHFHCHVIPRYAGDMENPKGGIRYCIPNRGLY